ncbi:hypothetical protein RCH09_003785, partial [Actimicrobium sp. GrIS 1.19]|nr:hypothetical protein [Actimicrobium sp. GrIS 1.19]
TLIHSCYSTTQRPALGQISIGTVDQYWVGANTQGELLLFLRCSLVDKTYIFLFIFTY